MFTRPAASLTSSLLAPARIPQRLLILHRKLQTHLQTRSAPVDGIYGSQLTVEVPTPLCQREASHIEPLGDLIALRTDVLAQIDSIGDRFAEADDGPGAQELQASHCCRSLHAAACACTPAGLPAAPLA